MRVQHFSSIAITLLMSLGAGAQVSPSPTQVPGVTAPTPQRQAPQGGGRQPLTPPVGALPPTLPQVQMLNGTLMGYVYWDPSVIPYNANSPCPFAMRVNQGTPPAGGAIGFEQFAVIGTYSNNFSSMGKVGKYVVCQYAVDHLPEGKDLQIQMFPTKGAFSTPVALNAPPTANEPNAPIKINGGKCNQLPPAVPSLTTLGSAWWSCGDHAYNINYLMQPQQFIPGLTQPGYTIQPAQAQPLLQPSGTTNGLPNSNPQQKTLLQPSDPRRGL